MKKIMYILISLIFISQAFSCLNDSVSPITEEIRPGRRDYEWSVDTVKSTMLSLINIWGNNPSDVWVVGNYGDFDKRMWHYDRNSWNAQGWRGIYAWSIYGFGAKDVYMGGYEIWHFDGFQWKKQFEPRLDSLTGGGVMITDIRGNSPNDLWAIGFSSDFTETSYGAIYHKDSNGWKEKMVLKKKNIDLYEIHPTGEGGKCLIYAIKYTYHPFSDSMAIYEYDGDKILKEIATGSDHSRNSECFIYWIHGKLLVEMKGTVYEYYKGQYKEFISIQALNQGQIMGGRSKSDMFIWQREGLAHYNGTDTQIIFKLKDDIWLHGRVAVFEKEIFFFGSDSNGIYYLVKGKLKD